MNAKILIVDDEEGIRVALKSLFAEEGCEVLTAEDYPSAVEIMSEEDVDLIFADVLLNGYKTGIDILRQAKQRALNCPVIMVTGRPNLETAAEAVRLGASDYLLKPVKKGRLIHVANIGLRHKALLDEKDRIETEKETYRRNLEAMFRSVSEAIVTVDENMHVIEANEASKRICGVSPKEMIGKPFVSLVKYCHGSCMEVLKETLKTKRGINQYRIECRHEHRSRQVVVLSSSPLLDRDNQFRGAVLVIGDITRVTDLEKELRTRHQFHNIIGKSSKMQDVYRLLEDLADTDTTVLVTGESGTGKELVAKALHYCGPRAFKPIVSVNCCALAENLLESELFGHVKGAFTGAVREKVGRFQTANGGTILFDEIGEISPSVQLRLLRVLQEKEFERVGDSTAIKVDVRVIGATNRDLKEKVRSGKFREDLYYRLKVVEVRLPPLRERLEDIPLLIDHFCTLFNERFKKDIYGVSDEVLRLFTHYPWPGNVRELEHAIEHAFVLCRDKTILLVHLPSDIKEYPKNKTRTSREHSVDAPEDIIHALDRAGWNKAKAARLLGISRRTIYRKIEAHKITDKQIDLSSVS